MCEGSVIMRGLFPFLKKHRLSKRIQTNKRGASAFLGNFDKIKRQG